MVDPWPGNLLTYQNPKVLLTLQFYRKAVVFSTHLAFSKLSTGCFCTNDLEVVLMVMAGICHHKFSVRVHDPCEGALSDLKPLFHHIRSMRSSSCLSGSGRSCSSVVSS